jgi:hypothetical protein
MKFARASHIYRFYLRVGENGAIPFRYLPAEPRALHAGWRAPARSGAKIVDRFRADNRL